MSLFEAKNQLERWLIWGGYPNVVTQENAEKRSSFFYDLGLRNAIIEDFSEPFLRRDFGALFENFIISEVLKDNSYSADKYKLAFWRTTAGAEVDLILHKGTRIIGCEIKISRGKISTPFKNRYPSATTRLITLENCY